MTSRRRFLTAGTLLGLNSFFWVGDLYPRGTGEQLASSRKAPDQDGLEFSKLTERFFIAHRGVHLGSSISGENSLEAISLAKRAGFGCVEFDVGLSRDGIPFVMHDKTLNRTVLRSDGGELTASVALSSQTARELKTKFKLKANEVRKQTSIPTYKEFLKECRRLRIIPFIELKLHYMPDDFYVEIVRIADEMMGRGNYVITSNNQANDKIRSLGITHAPVMGILYQTTFEQIQGLGNAIMAVSASRFEEPEFREIVKRCNILGIATESHSDNFERFHMIDRHGIDYISTDVIAPDLQAAFVLLNLTSERSFDQYEYTGEILEGILRMENSDQISLPAGAEPLYFGGIYFDLVFKGKASVKLMDQEFVLESKEEKTVRYQLMIYNSVPRFVLIAMEHCEINQLIVKVVQF